MYTLSVFYGLSIPLFKNSANMHNLGVGYSGESKSSVSQWMSTRSSLISGVAW